MSRDTTRTKAVILTTQRTGSTFLIWCLATHPEIDSAGELLIGQPEKLGGGYRGRFQKLYKLKNIIKSGAWWPERRLGRFFEGGEKKVRIFKAMYNQLAYPPNLRYLRAHKDIRVIHLRRQNLLKNHVSRLLMPKRKQVQTRERVAAISVRVDPAHAIAAMREAQKRHEHFAAIFSEHPRLPITYETLIDGQSLNAETGRRICEFLGVAWQPMQSSITKLNPESLKDMVENYDELAAALSRTEFAEMLD